MDRNWKKNYFIILTGQGISSFTSAVLQMAMVWYLTEYTKSAFVLTMSTLIGFLPRVVLGPFIGVFIDRHDRKRIMIFSDCFIAVVSLLLVFAGHDGKVPVWIIMLVMLIRSVGAAFHAPAIQAVTPMLVPKKELARYAGISQGVESVSMLLSPGVAAFLFSFWTVSELVWLDVAGVIVAVFTIYLVRIPDMQSMPEQKHLWQETKAGFAAIKRVPGLWSVIIISGLYAIIYFPIGTLFPHISMNYFQGSFRMSGVVETVFSIGMLLGAAILGAWGNHLRKDRAISFSIGLYGVGLFITGFLPEEGLYIFVVLCLFMGISIPFYRGVKMAFIQEKVEEEYMGRVLSLTNSLQSLTMPIGLIVAGNLVDRVGVNRFFGVLGLCSIILMAVSQLLPSFRKAGE